MERLVFTLTPKTAFATPLAGDTLFGQSCWALRHCFGAKKLTELLAGYTEYKPFMVIADVMPQGFLPRPALPGELLGFENDTQLRKLQKAKKWLPESVLTKPLHNWAQAALTESEMLKTLDLTGHYCLTEAQDHNSLNRQTGTTGKGEGFAPFQRQTFWYHPGIKLSLMVELDTDRLSIAEVLEALSWIGLHGYGKEASCGLGKFEIELASEQSKPAATEHPNAWLTLAPCAPQGLAWHPARCYYQVLTRFGRHGDSAVHQSGGVFKNPVLMAATGAVLTPKDASLAQGFTGQGISGVSKTITATVHQGYAPVYPVEMTL
jgi:CRISPR-associated protein Csm4